MTRLCRFGFAVLLVCSFFNGIPAAAQQYSRPPRALVEISAPALSAHTLQNFLTAGFDIAEAHPQSGVFEVIVHAEELEALRRLGIPYKIKIANLETYAQALRASDYLDHFFDYERTLEELVIAQAIYPELMQLVDIGDSWEKTQNLAERDLWAVKISDNVARDEDEPEVLIMALHHAREIITPGIVLDFMHTLLTGYGQDPEITYLVNHRQIWLIPVVNPDGLEYVFNSDLWWRKNRRRNSDGTFGVDLNRNYGFKWGLNNIGSSPNPNAATYRGSEAFSEPEIAAIRDFVSARRFRASLSYHSFGNLMIYPWGYASEITPDHHSFVALADSLVAYNNFAPGLAIETVGYFVNGDSDDWLYGEQSTKNKILALTPEVGNQFHPDTLDIERLIHINRGSNLFLTYAVGEEPIVEHAPLPEVMDPQGAYEIVARILPPIILTQPVALAPNTFRVHHNTTGTPPFEITDMTATGNPEEYAAMIPNLGGNQTVYYFISASDDSGRTGYAPRAASEGDYFSFYVNPATGISRGQNQLPQQFALHQNRPNPVRRATQIQYELPENVAGNFTLALFNVLGQQIQMLAHGRQTPGIHIANWNGKDSRGRDLPAGIYFYRLQAGSFVQMKKLLLFR